MFIATLIAAGRLAGGDVSAARDALADAGCAPGEASWIDRGDAADIGFANDPAVGRAALEGRGYDIVVQAAALRVKRLLVADMDSTMITVECIDELADYAGIKAEIAAVTEAAMRGELDFIAALDARVALLKGLSADAIDRCRAERVRATPGARTLVGTMRAAGARTILVSGGFTAFAEPVAAEIGFETVIANRLGIAGGALDGTVARPIVDAATKRATLERERAAAGLSAAETLAVGDGANDIPMIQEAGLGVAYHAKPRTAAAAAARIDHGDLTALLWAQGLARAQWAAG
ncbi:phosphoserine phosphatase SerB [Sphingomonas sp.]|uniref:phosphoserine phosphatase SerB n=1 Tax=Sphingomonas sp. TaxID=28214 RepID=UPI003B005BE0